MKHFIAIIFCLVVFSNISNSQIFPNLFRDQFLNNENSPLKRVWKNYTFQKNSYSIKYGFKDLNNNIIIPYKYDNAGAFSENLAAVCIKKYWGFIDKSENRVIPLKYSNVGTFSEGLAPVVLNNKLGFINNKGEWVIPPQFYSDRYNHNLITETGFSNEMAPVSDSTSWFYIDKSGNKLFGNYRYAGRFRNGIAIISNDSTKIFIPRYTYDENYNNILDGYDTTWVNLFALINTKGEIIESGFNNIDTLPAGFYITNKKETYTIIGNGVNIPVQNPFSVLVSPKNIIVDQQFIYKHSGKPETKLKSSGKTTFYYFMNDLKPYSYDEYQNELKQNNITQYVGKWFLCDSEFGYAIKPVRGYKNIEPLNENMWLVTEDSVNYGVINNRGEEILGLKYAEISLKKSNWLIIKQNDSIGLADLTGKIIFPTKYKSLEFLLNNLFSFSTDESEFQNEDGIVINRRFGIINSESEIVLPMKYQNIYALNPKNLLLLIDNQYDVANTKGQSIIVTFNEESPRYEKGVISFGSSTDTKLSNTDGIEITNNSEYKWEISPEITAVHNQFSITDGKYINDAQWKLIVNNSKSPFELFADSITTYSNCLIAYSSKGSYLVSFKGNIAGPYDGIIQPSSYIKDNWFEVNQGGILKTTLNSSGDTLYTEDWETGMNVMTVDMIDWKYFVGGKTGIVDENANVLIEPLYDKLKIVTEFMRYSNFTGENEGIAFKVVDLSQPDYSNLSYETLLSKEFPVEIYKNDSAGFDFWGQKNKIMLKADTIESYYPIYLTKEKKTGIKHTISNFGVSKPFNHIMRFGAEDEVPFFLVNIGGTCDTVKIEKRDSVYIEDPELFEMRLVTSEYTLEYPYFTGGKFYFLSDAGQFINQNPYDNVKIKVYMDRLEEGSESGYYEYKDVSDINSLIQDDALISVNEPIQVKIGNKWGLINKACEEILTAKYDSIKWENNQFLVFESNSVYSLDSAMNPIFISNFSPIPKKNIKIEIYDISAKGKIKVLRITN